VSGPVCGEFAAGRTVTRSALSGVFACPEGAQATIIRSTSDGGYILAGHTLDDSGKWNVFLEKLDADVTLSWSQTVSGGPFDRAGRRATNGGRWYIALYENTINGSGEIWTASRMFLAKIDASGNISWTQPVRSTDSAFAVAVRQSVDGSYMVVKVRGHLFRNRDRCQDRCRR